MPAPARRALQLERLCETVRWAVDRVAFPAPSLLVRCAGAWADRHPEVEALRHYVGERLRTAIGLSVDVRLVAPQTIPRSEGKAVRVVERA